MVKRGAVCSQGEGEKLKSEAKTEKHKKVRVVGWRIGERVGRVG